MSYNHQVIYVAASAEQAHMLANALVERGIGAFVTNLPLQFGVGELPCGVPTAPRVVVPDFEVSVARQVALEFDRALREGVTHPALDDSDSGHHAPAPWPSCPSCARPRHTTCRGCGTAGHSFPPAYMPGDDHLGAVAVSTSHGSFVLCPTCDEMFTPEFLARCEWCGYRFPDGVELPTRHAHSTATAIEDTASDMLYINGRAWAVILGLGGMIGAAVAYFYHLTR